MKGGSLWCISSVALGSSRVTSSAILARNTKLVIGESMISEREVYLNTWGAIDHAIESIALLPVNTERSRIITQLRALRLQLRELYDRTESNK